MDTTTQRLIEVPSGEARLGGVLGNPEAQGIVVFAHGSGSGRFSPRNQYVAQVLRDANLGALLIDLLEQWESEDRRKVFDIDLLAERLLSATEWLEKDPQTKSACIGYFGASTGAAAALQSAAEADGRIKAIVSRGGRPDLAMDYLPRVTAPTLLIVGGNDEPVVSLNRKAYELLPGAKEMVIVPGATHLFEEPGALEEVARLARDWFAKYLVP